MWSCQESNPGPLAYCAKCSATELQLPPVTTLQSCPYIACYSLWLIVDCCNCRTKLISQLCDLLNNLPNQQQTQLSEQSTINHMLLSSWVQQILHDEVCPRHSTCVCMKECFFAFSFSPAASNLCRMLQRLAKCSCIAHPTIKISSRYTKHLLWAARTVSMSLWKVRGALQSAKGITQNSSNSARMVMLPSL